MGGAVTAMNVLFFILPLSFLFAFGVIVVFILATRNGQWDDLDTPAHRILVDDTDSHNGDTR
jgi:cbb3-type cytochrome oxidase maturation protein